MTKLNHWTALSLSLSLVGAFGLGGCDSKGDDEGESASEATTGEGSSDSEATSGGSDSSTSGGTNNSSGSSESSDSSTSEATTGGTSGATTDATTDATSTGSTSLSTTGATSEATSDSDTDSSTGDPPKACGDAAPIEGLVTSMAYLKSQLPPDMTSGSGSSGSSGGEEQDPSTLYIRLSDQSFTCKDPSGILECGPQWSATIVIPPEYQAPGVYSFGLGDIIGTFTETGEDEGGNECGFGGGSWEGTLEIVAIDESQVEARLCDVQEPWGWAKPDLNGTFYADRC